MADLLELSLLLGLIAAPLLLARRSKAFLAQVMVAMSCAYVVIALFVVPRLPG